MSLFSPRDIGSKLAFALWGAALVAFVVAAIALTAYQSLTLEQRAQQIMAPYAELLAVGTDAAVAFEDPLRAQEILDTLQANRQILDAEIYLEDGRLLAGIAHGQMNQSGPLPSMVDGIFVHEDGVELLQSMPSGGRLRIRMDIAHLNAQTQQALWAFGAGMLVLLIITITQLAVLRRTIVRPIAALTDAAEYVRVSGDYLHRMPVSNTDELARLGQSFNAMMDAIRLRERELRRVTDLQRTILDNAAHGIISTDPEGFLTSLNPAAERLLGYRSEELIGRQTPVVWHDHAEVAKRARELSTELGVPIRSDFEVFAARPRRNLPEEREWTFLRKDGSRVSVQLSITSLTDEHGHVSGYVGLTYDLTERKEAEARLHHLNRELLAISDCIQLLVRAEEEQSLLDDICRIVCENAGYRMAWVGFSEVADRFNLRVASRAGAGLEYIDEACRLWSSTPRSASAPIVASGTGTITGIEDLACTPEGEIWRDMALRHGHRSSISLPLKDRERTFGVLSIYSDAPNAFTPEERRLLGELADDLAFGIVTLRARVEHAKAEEQIQIAATAFEAQEGIIITDANQVILRVNSAFSEMTGFSVEEVVGDTPRLLASGRHDANFFRAMWNEIEASGSWQGEIWNRRRNGEEYPEWLNVTAVRNGQGQVTHYVGTMVDITERKEAEARIEHLAFYDLLTGLPNRRLFVDRLQQAMAGSARTQRMGALLFVDLDNFKIVNDTCGHDVGDQLLIEVAMRLTACVREGDTISRFGGDEFVAMLEGIGENRRDAAAHARSVTEKILGALVEPYSIADRVHYSTPSIGVTLFRGSGESVDELLKQADIAMYQAKSAGRNTLRFFDPDMQAVVAARASLESDLREALGHGQFTLHYQPQVDGDDRVLGVEALLRWAHPDRGLVPPGKFIPLAEETGLILPIGQWVLDQACAVLADWATDPLMRHLQLAINVSARQFRQPDFVASVREAMERNGAPPARLKVELTESLVLDNVEDTIEKMLALRQSGVSFSMDDFGTGYSSLSYLTRLPLDQLKIDQSFVRNLPDGVSDAVVVQSIITLARSLGLTVIAEGVEVEAQRRFLEEHGCPDFQGYLFSKPIPLSDFAELIRARSG